MNCLCVRVAVSAVVYWNLVSVERTSALWSARSNPAISYLLTQLIHCVRIMLIPQFNQSGLLSDSQDSCRAHSLLDSVQYYPGEPAPERYNQEGKISLDLLEQETVSGSGISWAICRSAPCADR